jgi:hypothetical protein
MANRTDVPSPQRPRRWATLLILFSGLSAIGCGDKTGTIEGRIVIDRVPLPLARIELQPADSKDRPYVGESVDDGQYYMEDIAREGMLLGKYRAVITYHTLPDGEPLPKGEQGTTLIGDEKIRKHRVGFDIEIVEGHHVMEFDVSKGDSLNAEED